MDIEHTNVHLVFHTNNGNSYLLCKYIHETMDAFPTPL